MDVKSYCDALENQLTGWKSNINDVVVVVDQLPDSAPRAEHIDHCGRKIGWGAAANHSGVLTAKAVFLMKVGLGSGWRKSVEGLPISAQSAAQW